MRRRKDPSDEELAEATRHNQRKVEAYILAEEIRVLAAALMKRAEAMREALNEGNA